MRSVQKILNEFKTFALRGNVIDLAVGIVIGAAFNSVVNSLVKDIITPPIGFVLGKADFADLKASLGSSGATLNYGMFINSLISFLLTAWAVFVLVKVINKLHKKQAPPPEAPSRPCPYCLSDIPIKATKCKACTSDLSI